MATAYATFPKDVWVLIPAYKALNELTFFLPKLIKVIPAEQILVVIDGPCIKSEHLCHTYDIHTITHDTNQGKGAALKTGFKALATKAEWIITMDADGQHAPEDLPRFLHAIQKATMNVGLIVGSRRRSFSSMPFLRILSNSLTSAIVSLIAMQQIRDSQCGFRAYPRAVFATTPLHYNHFELETEVLLRASQRDLKILNLPIRTIYGNESSHIAHVTDTFRWIRAVLSITFSRNMSGHE